MNWPGRIYIKLFVEPACCPVSDSEFIPIFQGWIRDSALPGAWVDVADYGHVHHGPGVLLAGHDGHIMTDQEDGRLGLLYQARQSQGLAPDLRVLFTACTLLESSPAMARRLKFSTSTLLVGVNDRLFSVGAVPSAEWGNAVRLALEESGIAVSNLLIPDPRLNERPFVTVTLAAGQTLASLLESLP